MEKGVHSDQLLTFAAPALRDNNWDTAHEWNLFNSLGQTACEYSVSKMVFFAMEIIVGLSPSSKKNRQPRLKRGGKESSEQL